MSTSPISPSSGFPPSASLPDDVPEQGAEGPEILEVDDYRPWTPHTGSGLGRDLPQGPGQHHGGPAQGGGQGGGQAQTPGADSPPGSGTGKPQVGSDTPGGPGAGMRPPGGTDGPPRPGTNPGGMPGPGNQGLGNSTMPGHSGPGNGFGLGNALGGLGNLANGLLGRGGVLAAPLAMLNGANQGGLGNVLVHATPIPVATPPALPNGALPNGALTPQATPHATSHAAPANAHASTPGGASANSGAAISTPRSAAPTAAAASSAQSSALPAGAVGTTPNAAPLRGSPAVAEAAPNAAAFTQRAANADPAHAAQQRGQAGTANEGPHTQANAQANATRQSAVQALLPGAGALTLMVAPHAELAGEDTRSTSTSTLFREQGVDGRENVRDILGRSYVYTADGKLITRAQERSGVEAVDPTLADELEELSVSNHGELSTHDLLFKVVVPAFVGVGALLGGATAGAGIATGVSGMGGSFLLLAAAGVLGYGATRAIATLREMSAAGGDLNPFASRAAFTHWAAAGTQSTGSLAAIALLLF